MGVRNDMSAECGRDRYALTHMLFAPHTLSLA